MHGLGSHDDHKSAKKHKNKGFVKNCALCEKPYNTNAMPNKVATHTHTPLSYPPHTPFVNPDPSPTTPTPCPTRSLHTYTPLSYPPHTPFTPTPCPTRSLHTHTHTYIHTPLSYLHLTFFSYIFLAIRSPHPLIHPITLFPSYYSLLITKVMWKHILDLRASYHTSPSL